MVSLEDTVVSRRGAGRELAEDGEQMTKSDEQKSTHEVGHNT